MSLGVALRLGRQVVSGDSYPTDPRAPAFIRSWKQTAQVWPICFSSLFQRNWVLNRSFWILHTNFPVRITTFFSNLKLKPLVMTFCCQNDLWTARTNGSLSCFFPPGSGFPLEGSRTLIPFANLPSIYRPREMPDTGLLSSHSVEERQGTGHGH